MPTPLSPVFVDSDSKARAFPLGFMANPSSVGRGPLILPPGFRFHPTEEELVVHYLRRKAFSCPLPATVIPEFSDLCRHSPWDLPGGCEEERYFFCRKEAKCPPASGRSCQATGLGYWKVMSGKEKPVVASRSNRVVGMKRALVFYQGKPPKGRRTEWVMHELRLAGPEPISCGIPRRKNSTNTNESMVSDNSSWVICRITKKRATNMDMMETEEFSITGSIEFMPRSDSNRRASSSSASDSSCVTEILDDDASSAL